MVGGINNSRQNSGVSQSREEQSSSAYRAGASAYSQSNGYTREFRHNEPHYSSRGRGDGRDEIASRGKKKVGEARRAASNKKKRINNRRGIVLALSLIVMTTLILALIYKFVFVVTDISVVGNEAYTADEVLDASGIAKGVNLYSFRASAINDSITLRCPLIGQVEIDRNVPDSVVLKVKEESAAYYVKIFGETKLLSESLRVLGTLEDGEEVPEGLIKLKLPAVTYSVAGRVIELSEPKAERSIREALSAVAESPIADSVTSIDLRDIYGISMVCSRKVLLVVGDSENLELKLSMAAATMESELFSTDNKIRIDLTLEDKTLVKIDNLMELD